MHKQQLTENHAMCQPSVCCQQAHPQVSATAGMLYLEAWQTCREASAAFEIYLCMACRAGCPGGMECDVWLALQ